LSLRASADAVSRLRVVELASAFVGPLNFAARGAECLCISGPSGSGKTSLLRAIADLDVHQGNVLLDDIECNGLRPSDWRRRIGLLPAESDWWYEHVGEHFGAVADDRFKQLGFDRGILDRKVTGLSSGERQRLALLRLLTNEPQVLLLDEPTASLDPENTRRAEQLVAQYRRKYGAAVLWVSHDPRQIKRVCNRHLRLRGGRLHSARRS
jgi:UDP-glucose/iron transport system ATP-binding protein